MCRYLWKFVDPSDSSQFLAGEDRSSDIRPRVGAVVQVQGISFQIIEVANGPQNDRKTFVLHVHLRRVPGAVGVRRTRRA